MATKKKIYSSQAPAAIGPYSQAIKVGDAVYISGQIPLDPQTMELVSTDITMQAVQVFENLAVIAQAAGSTLNDVVKLTIYLTDLGNFSLVNQVMSRYFQEPYPARATIQISALPKEAQIEVDAIIQQ